MQIADSPCYVFNTHAEAEEAIQLLSASGIEVKSLSLAGKGYHTEEHPVGFYTAMAGALDGAVVAGGLSSLGAALTQLGVPKDHVIKYETAIKMDKYVLLVHGDEELAQRARAVLEGCKAWHTA